MGKNEQTQGQELNIDAATTKERIGCHWFEPQSGSLGEIGRLRLESDPLTFKQVDVVLYHGKVSQVICPYLTKRAAGGYICLSAAAPDNEADCYLLSGNVT